MADAIDRALAALSALSTTIDCASIAPTVGRVMLRLSVRLSVSTTCRLPAKLATSSDCPSKVPAAAVTRPQGRVHPCLEPCPS